MKIVVFGARGDVGSRVVAEALSRGHDVTGVVRKQDQIQSLPHSVTPCVADAQDTQAVAEIMADQDLAISALRPADGQEQMLVAVTRSVLSAAAVAEARVIVVGGAASLKLADDSLVTVLTAPDFLPEEVVPIARACQAQYELCVAEDRADWSYLCPPALLVPGGRTGSYRKGSDVLLTDANGTSRISMEDFAVALIDEAETSSHTRARFTVAN